MMPSAPVVRVAAIGKPYWLLPLNERWSDLIVTVSIAAGHVKVYLRCAAFHEPPVSSEGSTEDDAI